jgi:two-component system, chemotaxis family, chemotaxis protein CheY
MRALVIDDSTAVRIIIKRILAELGFEVHEAADGKDALERLKSIGGFQLAMVDWNMPVMNGYDLICTIRADHSLDGLKLMMVTTETELSQVAKALQAGANEYVMKPFTKDMILEKLTLLGLMQTQPQG